MAAPVPCSVEDAVNASPTYKVLVTVDEAVLMKPARVLSPVTLNVPPVAMLELMVLAPYAVSDTTKMVRKAETVIEGA